MGINRSQPHFALVEVAEVEPYGEWFPYEMEPGKVVQARKLLPSKVHIYGYVGLNAEEKLEYEPTVENEEASQRAKQLIEACNQQPNPYVSALTYAMSVENIVESKLRFYEVNPMDGSFVAHTLLIELQTGEQRVVMANQVPWE